MPTPQFSAKGGRTSATSAASAPLIGALLRISHDAVRNQILADVRAAGFNLSSAEFAIVQYPGPDGLRPIELAKQCDVSKQRVNYLLAGLLASGYIERRPIPGRKTKAIYLTERGRALLREMRTSVSNLERKWSALVGIKRYDQLRATLHEIASHVTDLAPLVPVGQA